jgi:phytoene synthase
MNQVTSMIRSDSLHCERVVRRNARAFTLATYFLPPRKRRAAFALYCFGKSAGETARSCGNDRKAATRRLLHCRRDLAEAIDGRPRGAVLREVRWALREFSVNPELLFSLVEGFSRDFTLNAYETWDELEEYCESVASNIGVMCAQVLGIPGGHRHEQIALNHARTLGVAIQLTTILRDAAANAREGICHLPASELSRFDLSREEIRDNRKISADPRWHRLIAFEIGRARSLYERSVPGISMLAEDSQRCAAACAIGYAAVLDALEHAMNDSLSQRASLNMVTRLGILWEAWRYKGVNRGA